MLENQAVEATKMLLVYGRCLLIYPVSLVINSPHRLEKEINKRLIKTDQLTKSEIKRLIN